MNLASSYLSSQKLRPGTPVSCTASVPTFIN